MNNFEKCVCKYFPAPSLSNGLDFEFGEKKGCELCVFSSDQPYPKTTFDEMGNFENVQYEKFDVRAVHDHGLLHVRAAAAIGAGNVKILNECLHSGLNVNNEWVIKQGSWSYLHEAVSLKKYDIMKLLIGAGANVNSTDYGGETPLFLFVSSVKKLDFIGSNILIDAGADPKLKNFAGTTPQDMCISLINSRSHELQCCHKEQMVLELLSLFLENGGVLTDMLRLAQIGCCDSRMYRIFLKAGADPYLKSTEGHNALYYLCNNNWECPQLKKSIILLTKVTTMTLEKSDIELQNGTECSICYSGKKTNFCQTLCCKQHLHVECLGKWLVSESNIGCKSCPFCRSTVKKVNIVTIKPTFTPVNVSKRSSERGLIFSYLFETKVSESGVTMYKI